MSVGFHNPLRDSHEELQEAIIEGQHDVPVFNQVLKVGILARKELNSEFPLVVIE